MAVLSSMEDFELAPGIDRDGLRRSFAEAGIAQISPFLAGDGAGRLRDQLAVRDDWIRAIKTAASNSFNIGLAESVMSPAQVKGLESLAAPVAESGFRYVYDQIVAVGDDGGSRESGTLLSQIASLLTGAAMHALLHSITGAASAFADVQATRYGPGQFLTRHNDKEEKSRRQFAYVLGLTEGWRPEWGGLLLFHDKTGEVVRGFVPRMNTLTIFSVPRDHSVTQVAPFAPRPRYSVTGWFHSENAPQRS